MKLNIADFANLSLLEMPAALRTKLEGATLVPTDEVPANVVTMLSRVRLVDAASGERRELALVYPPESDRAAGRLSVLDDLGIALLGATVGDTIEHRGTEGPRCLQVQTILYQPEHWMRTHCVVLE